jgi:hypothetical protein
VSKVVDLRALLVRKTVLLFEVGVTGSAKSRLFAIGRVIHAAGSIGREFAFPRRGDRGYHVFTDVRFDGGAIADRLPRGRAPYGVLWAPKLPKSVLAVSLSPVIFSLSFPRKRQPHAPERFSFAFNLSPISVLSISCLQCQLFAA